MNQIIAVGLPAATRDISVTSGGSDEDGGC